MSIIIQKLLFQVTFVLLLAFYLVNRPHYRATLSLRAYRRRAQDSEVMVVSLLKCRSLSKLLLQVIFVASFVFEIGQINYGATLSLRAYRRRAQDSEVMVVSLLKCRSLSKLLLQVIFVVSFVFEIGQVNYGATLSLRAYRRRAQDSEVLVVSLLKCRSLSKLLLQVIFVLSFVSKQAKLIMGLPSPKELTGGAPKILR